MLTDPLTEAEELRAELGTLRRKISRMANRRTFDEVDVLLSVAEHQMEQIISPLRQARSQPQAPRN
jgi:hypothetical protein